MLRGERGMRPELFARLLAAAGAPFVEGREMMAGASSETLARATDGVLFVGDLALLGRSDQKNLEFLLTRSDKHKARVVSFASVDGRTLIEKHEYDAAMVARLSELVLKLPALREFAEDVPDLAAMTLVQLVETRACPPRRFSVAALNALRHHSWPGNLAELDSVVRNLALGALDEDIGLEDVERVVAAHAVSSPPPEIALDRPYREAREAFERLYFQHLLARENGSMSKVAERSGLERTHLYRKLKALGLPVGRREET
jgi:DNA-binding NtrC family response regulator